MPNLLPEFQVFANGIPFEGPLDVSYFEKIPNASVARMALDFISNQANEFELYKRHTPNDVARMWKSTLRACITHGVEIPNELAGFARRLGIQFPS